MKISEIINEYVTTNEKINNLNNKRYSESIPNMKLIFLISIF